MSSFDNSVIVFPSLFLITEPILPKAQEGSSCPKENKGINSSLGLLPMGEFFGYQSLPSENPDFCLLKLKEKDLTDENYLRKICNKILASDIIWKDNLFVFLGNFATNCDDSFKFDPSIKTVRGYLFPDETENSDEIFGPQNLYDALRVLLFEQIYISILHGSIWKHLDDSEKNVFLRYHSALEAILNIHTYGYDPDHISDEVFSEYCKSEEMLTVITKKHKIQEQLKVKISPDHLLCMVLGIEADCADWLARMDKETRGHRTDQDFIKQYIDRKSMEEINREQDIDGEMIEQENSEEGIVEEFAAQFELLQFTESRSKCLVVWLNKMDEDIRNHLSVLDWAKVYIKNTFNYNILFTNVPDFQYKPETTEQWVDQVIKCPKKTRKRDNTSRLCQRADKVKIYNRIDFIQRDCLKYPPESDDSHLYLCHGTDPLSAKNIIEHGVQVQKGSLGCDFSGSSQNWCRRGFYLQDNYENAKKWAYNWNRSGAVLVYKIPVDSLQHFNPSLDLTDSIEKWREVVEYCRARYGRNIEEPEGYKDAKYIKGPICANGRQVTDRGARPNQYTEYNITQTCILDQAMADSICAITNIDGAIFLKK